MSQEQAGKIGAYNGGVEVLLVSNGPGEMAGWAMPLARALRRLAPGVSLQLALPPCQYATGREAEVAAQSGLFDQVYKPGEVVGLALAGPRPTAACVVHVGGDLWYSARLSRRASCPAVAYVERDLVVRRHAAFSRIATPTEALAQHLVQSGVPAHKVEAVGDLRVDAVEPLGPSAPEARVLLLLPGSRPGIFQDLAPLMVRIGQQVRAQLPHVQAVLAPSPFLPEELVRKVVAGCGVAVAWTPEERAEAFRRAALALTLPGSSNVELGLLAIPMLVWLPLYDPSRVPLEGTVEWISRIPLVGRWVKASVVRRGLRRLRFTSPVNASVGFPLVEEEVSAAPPPAVASRVVNLLRDEARLRRMKEQLREHFSPARGASERLARRVLELVS